MITDRIASPNRTTGETRIGFFVAPLDNTSQKGGAPRATGTRDCAVAETRNPKYVLALAVVAGAILVLGTWLKPTRQQVVSAVTGPPTPSQAERARLDGLAQRGQLERTAAYFSQIAFNVATRLVRLETGATGVIWDASGAVVTVRPATRFPPTVMADSNRSRPTPLAVVSAPPALPAAVLQAEGPDGLTPVELTEDASLREGEWLVAVWRTPDRHYSFAPGLHLGVTTSTCGDYRFDELLLSVPLTETMAGGAIVDQEGVLFAVILRCDARLVAMTVRSVEAMLAEARSLEGRILTAFGVGVSVLHEREASYFRTDSGMFVHEIWKGYSGDLAGVEPGDIITRIEDVDVQAIDDLSPLVDAAVPAIDVTVVRGRREVVLTLPGSLVQAAESERSDAVEAEMREAATGGYRVEWIAEGSRAEAAGIRAGDVVLAINGAAPRNSDAVRRALAVDAEKAAFLTLQRGGRLWGVVLG